MKLIFSLLISLLAVGCATTSEKDFAHLKPNMLKDEVLEKIGSPNRSEYVDGKEKWTYRFFSGPNKNIEKLMQITFRDGKVATFGEDVEENQRRQEIQLDYENREKKRLAKKTEKAQINVVDPAPTLERESEPETESSTQKPAEFIEQKGKRGPVTAPSSEEE